jgi:hypothetical protein
MGDSTSMTEDKPDQGATPDPAPDAAAEALGDAGKRALDAERKRARDAEKERDRLAGLLKSHEDAQKSEAERLAERAAAAEKAREESDARLLRLEVALAHGIGSDDLDLLGTGDVETLTARAKRIVALQGAAATEKPAGKPRPVESLQPGTGAANGGPTQLTRDDLRRMSPQAIEAARVEGRLDSLLSGKA